MTKRMPILIGMCWVTAVSLLSAEDLLRDAGFRSVGETNSVWRVAIDKGGHVEPDKAANGTNAALRVKAAALTQPVTLPAGLFELTVQGRGKGELLLKVSDGGERSQLLGKELGTYGYLFETAAGERAVTLRVAVDGTLTDAALRQATEEQKAAWALEKRSMEQFGF
ncbi:MAG: hypothetical protein PHR35_22225, partial [Kiritimatiellae bacterium]|nr:hypothetical protein [Kiritimatiellia bacterium]